MLIKALIAFFKSQSLLLISFQPHTRPVLAAINKAMLELKTSSVWCLRVQIGCRDNAIQWACGNRDWDKLNQAELPV